MPSKQDVKASSKTQSRSRRTAKVGSSIKAREATLLNLEKILIGEGILTQGSDRNAIARALGLFDRRPYELGVN